MSGTMFNASKQPLRDIEASMVFSAALSVLLTLVVPISDTYNCLSYIFVYSPLLSMFAGFFTCVQLQLVTCATFHLVEDKEISVVVTMELMTLVVL